MTNSPFATLIDVEPREIDWLWEPLIPRAMLTIMEGDPGIGKSFLATHLAALVSKGGRLPNAQRVLRGTALYLSAEDDPAYTIRPRVDAMGGDAARIRYLARYSVFDDEGLEALRTEVCANEPCLIIIDPLYAFVPSTADMYKPNEIRALLWQLSELAADVEAAIIVVRHLRKSRSDKALYQGVGSIDVIGAARSALLVSIHPEHSDLRVIAHLKHNLTPRGESWSFKLEEEGTSQTAILKWQGKSSLYAEDLSAASHSNSALAEAVTFLVKELQDGPRPAKAIREKGAASGHASRTIDRAKDELGIKSRKESRGGWTWSLASATG
jgi:hypothetical protein